MIEQPYTKAGQLVAITVSLMRNELRIQDQVPNWGQSTMNHSIHTGISDSSKLLIETLITKCLSTCITRYYEATECGL